MVDQKLVLMLFIYDLIPWSLATNEYLWHSISISNNNLNLTYLLDKSTIEPKSKHFVIIGDATNNDCSGLFKEIMPNTSNKNSLL